MITIDNPFEPINHLNIADDFPKQEAASSLRELARLQLLKEGGLEPLEVAMRKAGENHGKSHGKAMGKPWEKLGKPWDFDDLNGICESLLGR